MITLSAVLLALGLAAWFFWPALAEQSFVQLDNVTAGYFHFTNHFRGLNLVQTSVLYDYDVAGGDAFRMGFVQATAAVAGSIALILAAWRMRAVEKDVAAFILLALVLSTFMVMPVSRVLWENAILYYPSPNFPGDSYRCRRSRPPWPLAA